MTEPHSTPQAGQHLHDPAKDTSLGSLRAPLTQSKPSSDLKVAVAQTSPSLPLRSSNHAPPFSQSSSYVSIQSGTAVKDGQSPTIFPSSDTSAIQHRAMQQKIEDSSVLETGMNQPSNHDPELGLQDGEEGTGHGHAVHVPLTRQGALSISNKHCEMTITAALGLCGTSAPLLFTQVIAGNRRYFMISLFIGCFSLINVSFTKGIMSMLLGTEATWIYRAIFISSLITFVISVLGYVPLLLAFTFSNTNALPSQWELTTACVLGVACCTPSVVAYVFLIPARYRQVLHTASNAEDAHKE